MTDRITAGRLAQERLGTLQDKTKADATSDLRDGIKELTSHILMEWHSNFDGEKSDDPEAVKALVASTKAKVKALPVRPDINGPVKQAQSLSVSQAKGFIDKPVKVKVTVSDDLQNSIDNVGVKAAEKIDLATSLLDNIDEEDADLSDFTTSIDLASQAANTIEAGVSWCMNTASNEATQQVADAASVGTVIVGERDACLDCTDYIGQTNEDTEDTPPFHPNCACDLQPWDKNSTPDGEVSYPEALQREAERSVLRGNSSYDTNNQRVRAADELLKQGTDLPASVQKVAEKAIKSGSF